MQQFTDAEVHAKAVDLGLIDEGHELPRHQRGRVVAVLMQQRRAAARPEPEPVAEPRAAASIVIQPDGRIDIDGRPLPWLVAREAIDVRLAPEADGISTVRLTLLVTSVQIIKPEAESESAS
ncbi:hypothetical protein [Streptomyces sp. NPDC048196]|uniref:hypothetical protein n=1 Tax=Streptomyces sp. NPDC048196 TaxID=3154712 RepID=UPI0033EB4CF2